jgi:hypothetical protein
MRKGLLTMRHLLGFVFVLIVTIALVGVTAAQSQKPIVPDEDECDSVPQRSLVALFTTPEPGAPPAASPTALPESVAPVDDQTQAAVVTLTRAVLACFNAGDYWALITFVSDDYLLRSFGGIQPVSPTDPLAKELAPFVAAVRGCEVCTIEARTGNDRLAILSVGDGQLLADGRVRSDIVLTRPDGSENLYLTVLFVQSDNGWLIDQVRGIGILGRGSVVTDRPSRHTSTPTVRR